MKKLITFLLLILTITFAKAQKTNAGDIIITDATAKPGSAVVVSAKGTFTYLNLPPATPGITFIDTYANGVHQWVDLKVLAAGLPQTAGATGPAGPQGPQGPIGATGKDGIGLPPNPLDGQVPVGQGGQYVLTQAGITMMLGFLDNQTQPGLTTVICAGNATVTQGYTISSTLNIKSWTAGTVEMFVDYTSGGVKTTLAFPIYSGASAVPLFGAQNSQTPICDANTALTVRVVTSPDWLGTWQGFANGHKY